MLRVLDRCKGSWRPGMPAPMSRMVLWLMTLEILIRGSDYLPGDPPGVTSSLTIVEQAMPLPVWGVLCITAGVIVASGILLKRHLPICYGGLWAAAIYMALAWGLFLRFLERGEPWAGWRTPAHFLMMALMWATLAIGTWWRHRIDEDREKQAYGSVGQSR